MGSKGGSGRASARGAQGLGVWAAGVDGADAAMMAARFSVTASFKRCIQHEKLFFNLDGDLRNS